MIKSFSNKETEELFSSGSCKHFPKDAQARMLRKLDMLDAAVDLMDLHVPPGNRLHALQGDRFGQYAISVNDRWRICFRFSDQDAFDVEICDYH